MGFQKGGIEQISKLSPEQMEMFTKAGADFDPQSIMDMFQTSVADPAQAQFRQQTIPGLQERFFAGGAGNSGAMNRAATGAGANLQSGLSGQLAQLLQQGQENTLNRQAQLSTAPVMENIQTQSSFPLMELLAPIAGGLATGGSAPLMTGMMSAKAGTKAAGAGQAGASKQWWQ